MSNSSSSSRIDIIIYYGGRISHDTWSVSYDRLPAAMMRISRSTTYSQFLTRLYQKTHVDSNEYLLKVFAKHSCLYMGRIKESLIQIEGDDNLSEFLDPEVGYPIMEVYVEKEQITHEVNPQTMSQQWGQYMSLLATRGLPSSNHHAVAGASTSRHVFSSEDNIHREEYIPNVVSVTQGLENIGIHNSGATLSHGIQETCGEGQRNVNFSSHLEPEIDHEEAANDPQADSFANFEDHDSEPDEVEFPIPPVNPEDDVNINVIVETLATTTEGMSSGHEASRAAPMPPAQNDQALYRTIPFFTQTLPEVPADSIDVPKLKYAKFYDSRKGKLDIGMVFKNKDHLMCAVKDYSIRHAMREYVVLESSRSVWKVICKHSTPGHCNLDRSFVASLLLRHVKCDPTYRIKNVIQTVKDELGFDIPYQKAWYSLRMAREIIYGTWESSVRMLPKYMGALQKWNKETIVEWEHKIFQPSSGAYVIKYVFWAFKPCIEGFQFCRRVITVDEIHFYTKYKHKMLIAATMDGNQQVLPLAFAIVDEGSTLSWKWFLQMLSKHIIRGASGMCLISYLHPNLITAVADIPDFLPPHGVHRYCLRHLCSNINNSYNNAQLKDLCWRAGSEYQIRKFNRTMDEIRNTKIEAYLYLDQIEKEKWTASYDGGWRHGIMTTNMFECINGVLKGVRRLPVTAIVELTFDRSVYYFQERRAKCSTMLNNNQLWTDYAYKLFKRWSTKSEKHVVTRFNQFEQSASVITKRYHGQGGKTHFVKIATRECSCGKWSQIGIPCSHAQKVCVVHGLNVASMVKQCYDLRLYRMTYSKSFQALMPEEYWDTPEFELVHDTTLRVTTCPGRQ
ncbi:UNVERIFIED_CONTAM: hypothetical protein Sradi_4560100 [Sesamum radiatum]|uniref:SWIM-type domain-containing protein n=1 Tax=Sesamum radiatum TaxID=300843 RepID=A0AAW2NBW0_SESRA